MLEMHIMRASATMRRRSLQQITYPLFVLLLITSIILPANVMAAPLPAPALSISALCTPAALAAGNTVPVDHSMVMPASADAPVTIPKNVVDRAVFVAQWRNHDTDAELVESLILSLFLLDGADADLSQLTASVRQQIPLAELNNHIQHPLGEIVYQYMVAALSIPALVPHVPPVWDAIRAPIAQDDIAVDSSLEMAQSMQRFDLGDRLLRNAQEYMAALHDCARQNPALATQYDALFAQARNATISDSAAQILQKNADFVLPALLIASMQPNGTAILSLDQVNEMGAGSVNALNTTMDEMIETAKEIDHEQTHIVDYASDEQKKEEAKKKAKEIAEKTAAQFKTAESAINASTIILGQLDPKLAKDFKTVTSSYLEIVKSINGWLEATAGLGTLDSIFSISTVIMTGNVLGAVMNVMSIFGEGKPSPEQQILQEIGKLRQQVNKLRQEMHARFDRIDAQLNTIFTTMQARFDQVDIQLGVINGNIRDVQRSLIELDLRLSQFERNNFELLNVLGRRPLLDAINSGLDYQRITGQPMPFEPQFVGFERTFHTWGTVHAFDPLNTGPSQRNYTDAALFHELTTYPLDTNLNYLNGWLVAHGMTPIATGMLASPRDWLLASRAYTQLGAEWPAHMAQIDAAELTELMAVGLQLEAAISNITAPSSQTPAGDSIFDVVATLYNGKIALLNTGLQEIETTYLGELPATFLDSAVPFDLFGGAEQALIKAQGSSEPWMPPGYTRISLEDPNTFPPIELSVPLSIQNLIALQKPLLLAELLKVQSGQTHIEMQVLEENRQNLPCPVGTKPKDCTSIADLTITVELYIGTLVWKTLVYDMGSVAMSRIESAIECVTRTWESKKPDFDLNAVVAPPTPDQQAQIDSRFASIRSTVDAKLEELQQALYARMFDQMDSGTLHERMVEIAGFKKLLDAFTTLGLPRAIENDEFLHAILFGEQRIFDDALIEETFAGHATQPITGAALLVNQRPIFAQDAAARVQLYSTLVDGYLAAIAAGASPVAADAASAAAVSAGAHREGADYLVSARQALELTVRIARIPRAQSPGGGGFQTWLPLVDR